MKKTVMMACMLLSLVAARATFAATVMLEDAKLEIPVPEGWTSEKEAAVAVLTAPDKAMAIVLVSLPAEKADKAFEALEDKLDKAVGKVKWDKKGTKDKLAGVDVEIWNGTAKDGSLQVEAIYMDIGEKTVGIYWFDSPESEKKYAKDIDTICKGMAIKK